MAIYKSKIGYNLLIPVIILLGLVLYFSIINQDWPGIIITALFALFFAHLYLNTHYTITGNTLIIKAGIIIKTSVDIGEINCISRTRNALSSPALSLDRLEIVYCKTRRIIISPKEQDAFLSHIKLINQSIQIN